LDGVGSELPRKEKKRERETEKKEEKELSREVVFEGRLAIDQMESLANQLGAPTAARKRLQADLLPRLSDYSAKRQRKRKCGADRRHDDSYWGRGARGTNISG